jgi:hypothetical protein
MRESLDNGLDKSVFRTRLNNNFTELYGTVVNRASNFTIALTDISVFQNCSAASNFTITIPTNASVAVPVGNEIEFMQGGAGPLIFAAAAGVTLLSFEGRVTSSGQNAVCRLRKIATDTWVLSGEIA